MNVQAYMDALSQNFGREVVLSPSGNATCTIGTKKVVLQWHSGESSFLVHVDICLLGKFEPAELYRRLLAANYLLAENRGAALSFDERSGFAGLCRTVCIKDVSPLDFAFGVRNMLGLAELWQERLEDWKQELRSGNTFGGTERSDVLVNGASSTYSSSSAGQNAPSKRGTFHSFGTPGKTPQPQNQHETNENQG